MPCPHFDVKIIQRSKRQSAVASAAYQSGERLFSEYDQKQKYYSHKSEIVHTEIMLPPHAPPEYADRNTLWNAAEAIEKQWNSQLARRFVLAIPRELPRSQYADLIRDYCREFFVSKGMIADFAIHDKGDGNPHAHILLTMRAMDETGKWLPKSRKVYDLDENGERTHSLLSSALEIWQDAPVTLLREHYRCHPKIINFCNQKFYHGQLIVMTKDHDEPDVLTMYRTIAGNHARGHLNQRQIDVIQQEVLPRLHQQNFQSIGIITPYRDQVTAIRKQLGDTYEVDTVHKFQGREQDAIILTSVDNVITDFVDDPHMLNVAVSRAVHSLAVVTSQDPRNDQTNYGDLTRYIEYNNFEVIQSQVYSVFDMLYHGYAEQRRAYLQKHKRVSAYDSENLMYSVIQEVLAEEAFSSIGCAVHVSLATLVKNYKSLTEGERQYARNPLTHVDFLLFNQMDKQPVLAIEVDGTGFHEAGSKQAERDMKKNSILEKCAVPLLRLRTDGSGEKEKIKNALKRE